MKATLTLILPLSEDMEQHLITQVPEDGYDVGQEIELTIRVPTDLMTEGFALKQLMELALKRLFEEHPRVVETRAQELAEQALAKAKG